MEALVTGATGFIGSWLARTLLEEGWTVRCLARPTSPRDQLAGLPVSWFVGDVCDPASLEPAVAGVDAVFHVAGHYALWSKTEETFRETNVEGTRNVLQAAKAAGVKRIVHTSSVACVGQAPAGETANEDTRVQAGDLCGAYKQTKWEGEQVVLAAASAGQDVVIVNPSSVIGPGDLKPTPTGKIIVDFLTGQIPFYLDTGLNFVDVRDVARGHVLAFDKGVSGRRYILGNTEGNRTLREFLEVIGEVTGRKPPRFKIPYGIAYLAGVASTLWADAVTQRTPGVPLNGVKMARQRMFFDPARAIGELGLPQTPLAVTVADAVAYFRQRGLVPS
ncbi:MAG: NAD-dependent epimerase/dehydratase family protein [Planctomycetes bacterium]|nr:NAD-dependent epimerase/dehydratase family protein [Planctomycetota bacterium]